MKNETEIYNLETHGWDPCPVGLISDSVSDRKEAALNRRMFFFKSAMGAVLGAAGIRAYVYSKRVEPNAYEDFVSCFEVDANLEDYVAKNLVDMDLSRKIGLHLKVCTYCADSFEKKVEEFEDMTARRRFKNLIADNRAV